VRIFRPLLEHSRAALRAYAQERGLRWIEDESNASTRPDRNFLRHDIGPLLDERYPGWREAIARFARHAGAASGLLDQLATADGAPLKPGEPLPLDAALSDDRRANVLRVFLARNAVAMPSEARLDEIARQLFEARDDARVRIDHAGVSIVRHRNTALIDRHLEAHSIRPPHAPAGWRVDWHRETDVELGGNRGTVHFDAVVGEGIAAETAGEGEWYLASRSGGETIRLGADRPTRTLKNLLQEREIPMWQREEFPLLFHGSRLVWVPGVGIAAEYACKTGQPGLLPSWRVAGKAPVC
jgi:tRNA(Ile)-lysidine synthase